MPKLEACGSNLKGVRLMLSEYIRAAMRRATYEILSDGTYYGEISGFQGVYANEGTLENCRQQLQEVLEGWIILGLRLGHKLPVVDGITLSVEKEAA
jgi:predicted RNase H-like HicB family nuclease